ncbi:MAG: SapC family protein [Woeseiaceae bacterium]|nr:SapC family protein [Woeseiaceae bacterium]
MAQNPQTDKPNLFLYEQPELLTLQNHGDLGMTPLDKPYTFAKGARGVPLTLAEFTSAQRYYPIVFTSLEKPFPIAIVGLLDDDNVFMTDGAWDPACYVPAYLRCHPFAFAGEQQGRIAVVVDRAAATVTTEPKYPFFRDGKLTSEAESLMRFCARYEQERQRTEAFAERLKALGLLASQQATHKAPGSEEEQQIASYVSIDADKLAGLDDSAVLELHKNGTLPAAYLQLYSLDNWQPLLERRERRRQSAA